MSKGVNSQLPISNSQPQGFAENALLGVGSWTL
jgi:hypothetical protein